MSSYLYQKLKKLTSSPNESSTKLSPVAPNCGSSAIVTLFPVILMVHSLSLVELTEITEKSLDNSAKMRKCEIKRYTW